MFIERIKSALSGFLSPPTSNFLLQHLHSSDPNLHNFITNGFFLQEHNETNFKDLSCNKNSLFSLPPDAKILFILSFGPKCRTCRDWDEAVNNSPYYPVTDKTTLLIHLADSHMMWTRTEERLLCFLGNLGQHASSGSRSLTASFLSIQHSDNTF